MDSLIVLRKPLRKTQLEPKFIIPKKAVPKVDPIPPNPGLGEKSNEPAISFVELYKDLCVENSTRATSRVHARSPTRVHVKSSRVDLNSATRVDVSPAPQFECPPGDLHVNTPESHSNTSLVTHYFGTEVECNRLFTDLPTPSSARAEVILELDYDISSKDSGFC